MNNQKDQTNKEIDINEIVNKINAIRNFNFKKTNKIEIESTLELNTFLTIISNKIMENIKKNEENQLFNMDESIIKFNNILYLLVRGDLDIIFNFDNNININENNELYSIFNNYSLKYIGISIISKTKYEYIVIITYSNKLMTDYSNIEFENRFLFELNNKRDVKIKNDNYLLNLITNNIKLINFKDDIISLINKNIYDYYDLEYDFIEWRIDENYKRFDYFSSLIYKKIKYNKNLINIALFFNKDNNYLYIISIGRYNEINLTEDIGDLEIYNNKVLLFNMFFQKEINKNIYNSEILNEACEEIKYFMKDIGELYSEDESDFNNRIRKYFYKINDKQIFISIMIKKRCFSNEIFKSFLELLIKKLEINTKNEINSFGFSQFITNTNVYTVFIVSNMKKEELISKNQNINNLNVYTNHEGYDYYINLLRSNPKFFIKLVNDYINNTITKNNNCVLINTFKINKFLLSLTKSCPVNIYNKNNIDLLEMKSIFNKYSISYCCIDIENIIELNRIDYIISSYIVSLPTIENLKKEILNKNYNEMLINTNNSKLTILLYDSSYRNNITLYKRTDINSISKSTIKDYILKGLMTINNNQKNLDVKKTFSIFEFSPIPEAMFYVKTLKKFIESRKVIFDDYKSLLINTQNVDIIEYIEFLIEEIKTIDKEIIYNGFVLNGNKKVKLNYYYFSKIFDDFNIDYDEKYLKEIFDYISNGRNEILYKDFNINI